MNVTVAKWYCLSKDGVAVLCANEEDALSTAAYSDRDYPNSAPHAAAQLTMLARVVELEAEVLRLQAQLDCADHDSHHMEGG